MRNSPAENIGTRYRRPEQSGSGREGSYTGLRVRLVVLQYICRADWNGLLIVWKLDPEV